MSIYASVRAIDVICRDPKPWVAWGVRYEKQIGSAYFEPDTVHYPTSLPVHMPNPILTAFRKEWAAAEDRAQKSTLICTWIDCIDETDERTLDESGKNAVDRILEVDAPIFQYSDMRLHAYRVLIRLLHLLGEPTIHDYKIDPDGAPHGPDLEWVIRVKVNPRWIADGFDLSDSVDKEYPDITADAMIAHLDWIRQGSSPGEVTMSLEKTPDPALIRLLQGYSS